ncbi:unnamed protein product [Gordionus sp. m RMFG-2023]
MEDERRCYRCQERGHIQYRCPWNWERRADGNRTGLQRAQARVEEVPARQIAGIVGARTEQVRSGESKPVAGIPRTRRDEEEGSGESRPVTEIPGTRRDEEEQREHRPRTASVDRRIWPIVDLTVKSEATNDITVGNDITRGEGIAAAERIVTNQGVMGIEEWRDLVAVLGDVDELGGWLDVMVEDSEWGNLWEEEAEDHLF